jgi:hypothetical protein
MTFVIHLLLMMSATAFPSPSSAGLWVTSTQTFYRSRVLAFVGRFSLIGASGASRLMPAFR